VFSKRTPSDLEPNRLARALEQRRMSGRSFTDLTESNPTKAGFEYPADLLEPLGRPEGLIYEPRPFGLDTARDAVARDYARRGVSVNASRVVLTASTSESYSLLFKLLADPGDEVLVPRPSYPLFEWLTTLDCVVARPYELDADTRWSIDFASMARSMSTRTRAVLLVNPNNPTGSFVSRSELEQLAALCSTRGVAIIGDEVFADYAFEPGSNPPASVAALEDVLAFGLGGLSKSIGLPQIKLGWMVVAGPAPVVARSLERLEVICDSYLSVSTPVQQALGELLQRGQRVRAQIAARVRTNYSRLQLAGACAPACRVLTAAGGWYGVVQVPTLESEEALVIDMLEHEDVWLHPGYFFDFPRESFLVVSLLVPEDRFAEAIPRVFARATGARA